MIFHRMNKARELTLLINSETPLIYIETWEEKRVEAMPTRSPEGLPEQRSSA